MTTNQKKKRILIVTAFPTHGAGSGALITTQAKSYVEEGHKVVIITGNNRTNFDKLEGVKYHVVPFTAETENPEKIEGQCKFNYLMFTTHTESTANFWNVSLEQIEEYCKAFEKAISEQVKTFNPDIVHTQHNWITSSIATKFGKPIALTIHGTDLMGYKKAKEKLEQVNKKLQEMKNQIKKEKDVRRQQSIATLEKIYKNYSSKQQILQDIKKAMQSNEIDLSKEELKELVDLLDKRIIYNLYINHAENSASNSNRIIVISEDQRREFTSLFPKDADKVVLLENGYDANTFYMDENVKKEDVLEENKSDYDNLVLFVGKFADFKGIDALLNSAKLYEEEMKKKGKKVQTIIVGSGALDEKLRKQAETLNLENTYFVGRKNHEEICKLQNLSDVSLIPSRNEPFGLVVIEGTACGHPVIATNAGGIPGILNTNHQDISDKTKSFKTSLGILVPPLPERPTQLSDEQKDKLDQMMTEYMILNPENQESYVESISNQLGLRLEEVETYISSYMKTVQEISNSVVSILSREVEFDKKEIAEYTKDNYSQDVIREKILGIFNEAINAFDEQNQSREK